MQMIDEKCSELSGLVSPHGAAWIVAQELGVVMKSDTTRELKISALVPGLRSINLNAQVIRLYEPKDFDKNGKKGQIRTVVLSDETDIINLVLFNDECAIPDQLNLGEGSWVKLSGVTVTERLGKPQLRLMKGDIDVDDKSRGSVKRVAIPELKENESVDVRACLVHMFEKRFFEVCSVCGGKLTDGACPTHKSGAKKQEPFISFVIDDGESTARCVCFRALADKIASSPVGKELIFRGRVKKNINGGLDLVVNSVREPDPKQEARMIISNININQGSQS